MVNENKNEIRIFDVPVKWVLYVLIIVDSIVETSGQLTLRLSTNLIIIGKLMNTRIATTFTGPHQQIRRSYSTGHWSLHFRLAEKLFTQIKSWIRVLFIEWHFIQTAPNTHSHSQMPLRFRWQLYDLFSLWINF